MRRQAATDTPAMAFAGTIPLSLGAAGGCCPAIPPTTALTVGEGDCESVGVELAVAEDGADTEVPGVATPDPDPVPDPDPIPVADIETDMVSVAV